MSVGTVPDIESLEVAILARVQAIADPANAGQNPLRSFSVLADDDADHTKLEDVPKYPSYENVFVSETWQPDELLGGYTQQEGLVRWNGYVTGEGLEGRVGGRKGVSGVLHCTQLVAQQLSGWEITPGCRVSVTAISFSHSTQGENASVTYAVAFEHPFIFNG